jgi:gamma-glutamylcyclotransferase (GGCT)/AIG2-like uncharacterized protein YtfP
MHKVFVYGSLLSGLGNHRLLEGSTLVGNTVTPPEFTMLDLGAFPGVIHVVEGGTPIMGEVYEVTDETLNRLDRLEGYNSFEPTHGLYNRMEIPTEFGEAFIYTYNNMYGRSVIHPVENGDWRTYHNRKFER